MNSQLAINDFKAHVAARFQDMVGIENINPDETIESLKQMIEETQLLIYTLQDNKALAINERDRDEEQAYRNRFKNEQ